MTIQMQKLSLNKFINHIGLILLLSMLTACGGKDRLAGERHIVLGTKTALEVDENLQEQALNLRAPESNVNWTQFQGSASRQTINAAIPFERKRPLWSRKLGKGNKSGVFTLAQPVIFADTLYWVDHKFRVSAHNLNQKGKKLWEIELPVFKSDKNAYGAGIAVNAQLLVVTTGSGFVYGLSRSDGKLLWQKNLNYPIHSPPALLKNETFVTAINNFTFAMDAGTGAVNWTHESVPSRVGLINASTPAVSGDIVVAGYSSGEMVALDRNNGEVIWKQALATSSRVDALGQIASIVNGYVIDGGQVFASSYSGKLASLQLSTGVVNWELSVSASTPIVTSGDYLFVLDDQSVLYGIHKSSGRVRWVEELQNWEKGKEGYERIVWNGILLAEPYLVLANHEKRLLLHNANDGEFARRFKFGSGFLTHPIASQGVLYIIASNGRLYALK